MAQVDAGSDTSAHERCYGRYTGNERVAVGTAAGNGGAAMSATRSMLVLQVRLLGPVNGFLAWSRIRMAIRAEHVLHRRRVKLL